MAQIHIRILQTMVSGIPSILGPGTRISDPEDKHPGRTFR